MATPDQQRTLGRLRPPLAHMAYRLGENATLLRQNLPLKRQEGLLVVSDAQTPLIHDPEPLCAAIWREMGRQHYQGVVLDFEQAPTPDRQAFVAQLTALLHQQQKALYLPPAYAPCSQTGIVLIDTAISGGNFRQYLDESKSKFGNIALDLQRLQMDFVLPATQGIGTPLRREELTKLQKTYATTTFFSHELCTRYFTYQVEGQTHFVLFDDGETMVQKIRIATSLGIDVGLCVYHEIDDLLGVLFGKH